MKIKLNIKAYIFYFQNADDFVVFRTSVNDILGGRVFEMLDDEFDILTKNIHVIANL